MLLTTPRLLLKSFTAKDIHNLFNTQDKDAIMRSLGADENSYEKYKQMHEQGMESYRISMLFFLLIEKHTNQPMGQCGFHTWNTSHHRAELFYFLHKDEYKRKGYMKEALPEVLQYGFTEMMLHRIEALVAVDNTPSLKLLLHHHFTPEGTVREDYLVNGIYENSECYSLLKWEWELNKSISED